MPLTIPPVRSKNVEPVDNAYLGWSVAPEGVGPGAVNASGTLYGLRIPVPVTISVTNMWIYVNTAGATLTAAQNLLGLYTSAGAKIAQTADQATAWTATGLKSAALTGGPFTIVGGPNVYVYAAILSVGTTPPVFRGINILSAMLNANQTVGLGGRCVAQTAQTTIPATFAPAAVSGLGQWVALS